MQDHKSLYDRLRVLAVEDPKEARRLFLEVFAAHSPEMGDLLAHLRRPSEGRLRQVVANALRNHSEKHRMVADLRVWQETETDEFTRRAIDAALRDVDAASLREGVAVQQVAPPSELIEVYRYVSERLRHRLRNVMFPMQAQVRRLSTLVNENSNAEGQAALAKLSDAIISMGRELEATDVDPSYFQQRSINLPDWLRRLNSRYASQYVPIPLVLTNADDPLIRVIANDHLLDTIFWNVWLNAHQSAGESCRISIIFRRLVSVLEIRILDNGNGFPADLQGIAFQQMYSTTKSPERGRGLLEMQDAVQRLAGRIELYQENTAEFRLRIFLRLEEQ